VTGKTARRVLVVEDDFLNALAMKHTLVEGGAVVVGPVASESEAFALVDSEPLDGALLDINLGHGTTFALATALLERGVPFAFVTGHASKPVPDHLQQCPRLIKPVSDPDLHAMVKSFPNCARQ
jgi:CheY-like chemotaxis protein